MIEEIHITNLAVIQDTTITFPSSYVSLVGETGAGKSLIVDSLSLLCGERSDFTLLRDKNKKATISAIFSLSEEYPVLHEEMKDYLDGNEVIIKRVINPDKTTRCYVNDEIVTLSELKRVTSHLIDIHSQGAKSELLDENRHIVYLDRYDKNAILPLKAEFQNKYKEYLSAVKELDEMKEKNKELDRDYLSFQIKEIEKYHLQENEIEDLNAEFESLRSFEDLKKKYDEFSKVFYNSHGDVLDDIGNVERKMNPFLSTSLKEQASAVIETSQALIDSLTEFNESFKDLNQSPERIDEINERLFELKGLQRKYGKDTKTILNKLADYKDKLNTIDNFETVCFNAEKKIASLKAECLLIGSELTQKRQKAAARISKAIGEEMSSLGLRKNAFQAVLVPTEMNMDGLEKVSFRVALNAGLDYAPLAKAASGGEASRLMLALKVILNALDPYDLVVFDEIDTGISGAAANLVARKMQEISKSSQILVISHLAQVVASSTSMIYICKETRNNETFTKSENLSPERKTDIIARMLSGDDVTEAAKLQAQHLIEEYRE